MEELAAIFNDSGDEENEFLGFPDDAQEHDARPLPNVKWGSMETMDEIKLKISQVYMEIVTWKKNILRLPRGQVGRDFITELTRLVNLFNFDTVWRDMALSLVMIFPPLLLQQPSAKAKAKDNIKYMKKRLQLWKEGDLDSIMSECREIQKRIKFKSIELEQQRRKAFCRLMMEGKVAKALNFIDHDESATLGVMPIDADIISRLKDKHPPAADLVEEAVLPRSNNPRPEPMIFEAIDKELITKCTKVPVGQVDQLRLMQQFGNISSAQNFSETCLEILLLL